VTRENGTKARATGTVSLHWESASYYQSSSDEDAYVELLNKEGGSRVTHGQYRHGRLLINVPSTTYPRLIIANSLKLNTEYLYGIAEMPSSWDSEALQAQAIAARGYALNAVKTYSSTCGCNLYDDARSQNFSGWKKENEGTNAYYGKRWVAAVDATNSSSGAQGKVLMYGNSIAKTYYFSSSGGQTERSEDIWVSQPGYLKSVNDPWSLNVRNPNDSWTYTLTQSKARSIFGLSDVMSIKVTSRTAGGSDAAAKVVTATSSSGKTATISGPDSIRNKIVAGKSPWIWSFNANY
jgi:stage II sporulation protein D